MNLAVNARDAMPDGGRLHFELNTVDLQPGEPPPIIDMPSGRWIRIAISDNGIGIPQDNLPHIYEPFFTTKPPDKGTGLGLYVSRGIMNRLGGDIIVRNVLGKGTTFTVIFPKRRSNGIEYADKPEICDNILQKIKEIKNG